MRCLSLEGREALFSLSAQLPPVPCSSLCPLLSAASVQCTLVTDNMAFCLPDNSWRPLLQLLGSVLSEHWGCHGQIFCPQVFSVPWSASYGSLSWDRLGFIVVLFHVLPTDTPDLYGLWHGPVCCGLASRRLSLSSRYQETQWLSLFSASCCLHRPGCPSPPWTSALCFQGVQGLTE